MTRKIGEKPYIHETASVSDATLGRYTEVSERCRISEVEFGDAGFRPAKHFDSALLDGVQELDDLIDFDRDLATLIPDWRKRTAIRLLMEGVPRKSKKLYSVAKALGVDESTVRNWISEVGEELKKRKESKS